MVDEQIMSSNRRIIYVVVVFQTLILIAAVLIGHSLGRESSLPFDRSGLISKAIECIMANYRDKDSISSEKLTYGAIKGMLESLKDPYSQFLDVDMYKDVMDDTSGKFGGLGIEIGITTVDEQDRLTVISAFEGNPAQKAGVESGDFIIEINSESTYGISLYEAKRKLRGEPGSKVSIKVMREQEEDPITFNITRGLIQIKTVKYSLLDNKIGYIKLTQFADTTPKDVDDAINSFEKEKANGIILDLRSNPGGTLSAAVEVAGNFLKKGQLIVSTRGRRAEDNKKFYAKDGEPHTKLPLAVLVDRWSASGSEIVVGAIKDYKRGVIIGDGKSTFGKGSVQTIFQLDAKTGLKLTVAYYYTPNGTNINEIGIEPDIKRPSPTPSELKMYRNLYNNKNLDEFVSQSGNNILKRLSTDKNYAQDRNRFDKLIKKLSEDGVSLNEELIKFAIAQKTNDQNDDYEYDPIIKFAMNHLKMTNTRLSSG